MGTQITETGMRACASPVGRVMAYASAKLEAVKVACTTEMSNRVKAAAEALQDILQSPTAVVMEGKIAGLARQGKLDSSLLELLDMNYKQAAAAGEPGKQAAAACL